MGLSSHCQISSFKHNIDHILLRFGNLYAAGAGMESTSLETQTVPTSFELDGRTEDGNQKHSVYISDSGILIMIDQKRIQIRDPAKGNIVHTMNQFPVSVCMDDEYGYAISGDNSIRKFHLSNGKTVHKWPVPMNAPIHHQMAVIDRKIYYCNVNNNEIIIFPTTIESAPKQSIMSLGRLEKPTYIADNTKHKEETVIISGASGVGKFPIRHGFSDPEWFTDSSCAKGICVDGRGMIYVARCQPPVIDLLSQQTGELTQNY